ncbi:MAG: hypothetical protein ACOH12_14775 [Parvibaculaceae bacterium]
MTQENTTRKLADMTDEGAFERLATAILRGSDYRYRSLVHPGVNADGKTIKSPVDGITFVPEATPPHMIAAHHTTCALKDLGNKWLHDPATVKPHNKNKGPTAPAGDIIKTIEIVAEERKRTPDIQVTLILTTNQEPGEELVRNVHAAGTAAKIAIDIWARSRLADVLDNDPRGQWLRSQFLGITQIQLSEEMLNELSKQNLALYQPPDLSEAWVARALDDQIKEANEKKIVFVIAESGSGKSVACYKHLLANISADGFGLILTDEIIASSLSLEQAVEKALIQLHPSLMPGCGRAALEMSSPRRRLILAVEDINRSGRGTALIEKILRWEGDRSKTDEVISWQLLCPVWPQVISSLSDEVRKKIGDHALVSAVFSAEEGTEAVSSRRILSGHPVTKLVASSISEALGHDPLLIALHDPSEAPDTSRTIAQFIEASLKRLSEDNHEFLSTEYRAALSDLTKNMLLNRQMEPEWMELRNWPALTKHVEVLRHMVRQKDIIRVTGPSTAERLAFRHDRVREWLLAQAASDLIHANAMPVDIAAEPYFAEIFGLALARRDISTSDLSMIASQNQLALFCALRHFGNQTTPVQAGIIFALETWLDQPNSKSEANHFVRWSAMRALAEVEAPSVIPLVSKFEDGSWDALRARYRNGDVGGGIGLCLLIEPGVSAVGHKEFLDHVKVRFGENLIHSLASILSLTQLDEQTRIGALRLAGHIGEPTLANAVRRCWDNHTDNDKNLADYLWASAQCTDNDPATLLGPICDKWAALPDTTDETGMPSQRVSLAAFQLKFSFRNGLPDRAMRYFIERASSPELNEPITSMLCGLDHPDAVEFDAQQLAAASEKSEKASGLFSFATSSVHDWVGSPMSELSKKRLHTIWEDKTNTKHLRKHAFQIWASSRNKGDIEILRTIPSSGELADIALWQRLRRGDHEAIPSMIVKLADTNQSGYWWQLGRHVWSSELSKALDNALEQRGKAPAETNIDEGARTHNDWILSEMVMRLPVGQADTLLSKYWDQLGTCSDYVIAALYVATPNLRERVAATIKSAAKPKELIKYFSMLVEMRAQGRSSWTRPEQLEAIQPYLNFLEERDISRLWSACNEQGWFHFRREHLDLKLPANTVDWVYLDGKRVMNALDEFMKAKDPWINEWFENYLKSGTSLDEVISIINLWLQRQSNLQALQVACSVVLHIGERRHIGLLKAPQIEPAERAAELIANTEFGVKRRTLLT